MKKLLALLIFLPSVALADTNITVPRNANATIQFELRDAEGAVPGLNLEASASCANTGSANDSDVRISKDGAAMADATNCFVDETNGMYSLILAAADVDGKVTTVRIVDQTGTKVWVDKVINVYTYGDSSAFHAVPNVNVSTITDGAIAAADFASGAITADAIATNAIGDNEMNITGSEFSAIPWNAAWDAEVESECNDSLVANHLDHLLAADYDPASKPGTATALLNELVESDGGVSQFTANALEEAPSGGGGSFACEDYFACEYPASPTAGTLGEGVQIAPRRD